MNTYDFRALNDKEFESLAVDLLSAENAVRIERFKPGQDLGVDGRWFSSPGRESVIQCKHWIGSGYKALVKHLQDSERPKVDRLQCSRYILATSVPLSRVNKAEIASIMAPYVLSETDVIGAEDLNDMLGRNPHVERRHYKLWLSSSNTIALLLNNAIVGRSRAELEQIRHEAPLYVMTTDHKRAAQHLSERRVLVLTGEPGIGKTTLARQLVLEHVTDGFELVVLEESISEAENVFSDDAKQVFYFDDFLGRTFLEAIKAKQDSHILRFITRIARDPRKRFILTSRTNILNQGAELSDIYADVHIVKSTYELKVGDLSTLDRARILYNHIWHSNLGEAYVDELYTDKRYHQIIKHKNYNPRLVAFVVDGERLSALTPAQYWAYVSDTFQNPREVWSHFFSAQLSQDDRDLAYLVVLNGGHISEEALRKGFFALPSHESANEGLTDHRFWVAVRHVSGAVINRSLLDGQRSAIYSLYNPSIADFVQAHLAASDLWQYYYRCIRTLDALSRLEQMRPQPFFGIAKYRRVLHTLHASEAKQGHPHDGYNLRLTRLLAVDNAPQPEAVEAIRRWMTSSLEGGDEVQLTDYIFVLRNAFDLVEKDILIERAGELADYLEHSLMPLDEPEAISDVLSALDNLGAVDIRKKIRAQVVEEWRDGLNEQVAENNVLSSYFDPEDVDAAKKELSTFVTTQLAEMGVELTIHETNELCSAIDIYDVISDNIEVASREDDDSSDRWRGAGRQDLNEATAVDDLFDRTGR